MSFGFTMNSVTGDEGKTRRYAKRPLSLYILEIKVGLRVQSVLTDVYGKIKEVKHPYLSILWENGRISSFRKGNFRDVDVIDEQDEVEYSSRRDSEEATRKEREVAELWRLGLKYPNELGRCYHHELNNY